MEARTGSVSRVAVMPRTVAGHEPLGVPALCPGPFRLEAKWEFWFPQLFGIVYGIVPFKKKFFFGQSLCMQWFCFNLLVLDDKWNRTSFALLYWPFSENGPVTSFALLYFNDFWFAKVCCRRAVHKVSSHVNLFSFSWQQLEFLQTALVHSCY